MTSYIMHAILKPTTVFWKIWQREAPNFISGGIMALIRLCNRTVLCWSGMSEKEHNGP